MSTEVIQTMRTGGDEHPQEIMNFFLSFLTSGSGVFDKNSDDFKVVAQDTPNMTIKVKLSGAHARAVVRTSDGAMAYPVRMTTDDADLNISSNGSGNQRIDAVVLYIDLGAIPNTDISNVAKLAVVAGTPSASPSAPDNTAILSAIGASNPYIRLANVTVNSAETEIENSMIDDQRDQVEFVLREPKIQGAYQDWITLTPGANVVIDLSKGNKFKVTINQNTTFSVVNAKPGQSFQVRVTQNGTGGWTTTWFSGIGWAYQNTPVQTPTANRSDKYGFDVISEGVYDGVIMGQDQ